TWWAPTWLFAAAAAALMLAALAEWNRLLPCRPAVAIGVGIALAGGISLVFFAPEKWAWLCLAGALFWGWRAANLSAYGALGALPNLLQGAFVLLCAWCALLWMRIEHGAGATIAMLLVICAADICALFIGRAFGKRKLAPAISPGKTVAGLAGGIIGAGAAGWLCAVFALSLGRGAAAMWLLACIAAALFGAVGDLHASALKRRAGVKDSGRLLPGHGGILDRIDGLIAAAPVFAVIWNARAGWLA
ncbi:MAG: phosphatidate cytidylyltransferase, partial [Gammaproteobacteria bacterium]